MRHHEHESREEWPSWANQLLFRLIRLEEQMSELQGAENDLSGAVDAVLSEISGLESQVNDLLQQVSTGDTAAATATANAIQQQVARLRAAVPTTPPAPAPAADAAPADVAPADAAPATDQPAGDAPVVVTDAGTTTDATTQADVPAPQPDASAPTDNPPAA